MTKSNGYKRIRNQFEIESRGGEDDDEVWEEEKRRRRRRNRGEEGGIRS